jgi:hypothetical protein
MNKPITIPPTLTLTDKGWLHLDDAIADHNYRIDAVWREVGSNCKPFTSPESTVPAAPVDQSRVLVTAEHGGSFKEARS